jgi:23S rRNA pseudouridine1911/1915/1917 synthase
VTINYTVTEPPIPILYEDNHLLVVEKPVNIPSQEDQSGDKDMLTLLKEDLKIRYNKPGNVYLGLVHRLDRPVGGAMVFAKTSKAAARLSEAIRTHTFKKTYLAIIHGIPSKLHGHLVHWLLKDERSNTVRVVPKGTSGSKEAILDYKVLANKEGYSLVEVNLHTGRPHQIRVQLATIGHPLYGDQKYGAKLNVPGQQIALWSSSITVSHPTTKELMKFTSSPPSHGVWSKFM